MKKFWIQSDCKISISVYHWFPPHHNPGHVTSTTCRENCLRFQSLWLGFRIKADGQGAESSFRFLGVQCLALEVSLQFS